MADDVTELILARFQSQDVKLSEIGSDVKETQRLQRITNGQVQDHRSRLEVLENNAASVAAAAIKATAEVVSEKRLRRERWSDRLWGVGASLLVVIAAAAIADWPL